MPLLVPNGRSLPKGNIFTKNYLYLLCFIVVSIFWKFLREWSTLSDIEAESKSQHDRDFSPVRSCKTSSSSLSHIYTVDDTLRNQDVKPEVGDPASSSGDLASSSSDAPPQRGATNVSAPRTLRETPQINSFRPF